MPASNAASIRVGFQALRVNPLRTLLSTLGVIMGVGSMVSVLALGDGVEKYARDQVAKTTDLQAVSVSPITVQRLDGIFMRRTDVITLGLADVTAIQKAVPEAASIQLSSMSSAIVQRDSAAGNRGVQLAAVLPSVVEARKLTLRAGHFFTDADVAAGRRVVVLSATASDAIADGTAGAGPQGVRPGGRGRQRGAEASAPAGLLNDTSLVGRNILIAGKPFLVVGVLMRDTSGTDRMSVIVPFGTSDSLSAGFGGFGGGGFGGGGGAQMTLVAHSVEEVSNLKFHLERYFARKYGLSWSDRVSVTANSSRVEQLTQALLVFKLLMGSITGVSLLVGGIGIMNVLLAAVAERTREIGIRKAAGARNRDILLQFLSESVSITGAGAALGVLLGLAISFLAAAIMRNQTQAPVQAAVTLGTIGVAAIASIIVGLTFGLYPALRASRLSPIDAIRHD